ncbi:MAG: prophage regulatory protein [Oleiphilaceae bacterium]|jgi:prophage regulatory protein
MSMRHIPNTNSQTQSVLNQYGETERLVREAERKRITTLSRSRTTQLEREGKHPKRVVLGSNSCSWLLSSLLMFINEKWDCNEKH